MDVERYPGALHLQLLRGSSGCVFMSRCPDPAEAVATAPPALVEMVGRGLVGAYCRLVCRPCDASRCANPLCDFRPAPMRPRVRLQQPRQLDGHRSRSLSRRRACLGASVCWLSRNGVDVDPGGPRLDSDRQTRVRAAGPTHQNSEIARGIDHGRSQRELVGLAVR